MRTPKALTQNVCTLEKGGRALYTCETYAKRCVLGGPPIGGPRNTVKLCTGAYAREANVFNVLTENAPKLAYIYFLDNLYNVVLQWSWEDTPPR